MNSNASDSVMGDAPRVLAGKSKRKVEGLAASAGAREPILETSKRDARTRLRMFLKYKVEDNELFPSLKSDGSFEADVGPAVVKLDTRFPSLKSDGSFEAAANAEESLAGGMFPSLKSDGSFEAGAVHAIRIPHAGFRR